MKALTLPLIIAEGLDIGIYDSIEAAQREIEGDDVTSGIYTCFDAEGTRFDLGWGPSGAVVQQFLGRQPGAVALEELLRAFLRHFKDPTSEEPSASLATLIEAARTYATRGYA